MAGGFRERWREGQQRAWARNRHELKIPNASADHPGSLGGQREAMKPGSAEAGRVRAPSVPITPHPVRKRRSPPLFLLGGLCFTAVLVLGLAAPTLNALMSSAFAGAASVQAEDGPQGQLKAANVHDGGVCAGLSWIKLLPGERALIEVGPDFYILRFEGPGGHDDHGWGVYSGEFAQVDGSGPLLIQRDGVAVRRATEEEGDFGGYVAAKRGRENHFFGSVFNGTRVDRRFFDRVDFGPSGQALCAKER